MKGWEEVESGYILNGVVRVDLTPNILHKDLKKLRK